MKQSPPNIRFSTTSPRSASTARMRTAVVSSWPPSAVFVVAPFVAARGLRFAVLVKVFIFGSPIHYDRRHSARAPAWLRARRDDPAESAGLAAVPQGHARASVGAS